VNNQDGSVSKIYNLGVGKYDVTITTGASYATKRMEGADFLTQLVQSSPDLMPIIGDLLFKSMDMPYAEEISERMKLMMPPQLQKQDDGTSPEVQQVKQQATQVIQGLQDQLDKAHQAMQEADQEAKQLENKANDTETKNAIAANAQKIEWYNAETTRLKVELDAAQQAALEPARIQRIEDAVAALIGHVVPELAQPEPTEQPQEQAQGIE
jgi:hypothetical protein